MRKMTLENVDIKQVWLDYYIQGGDNQYIFRKWIRIIIEKNCPINNYHLFNYLTEKIIDRCVEKDDDIICTFKIQIYFRSEFLKALRKLKNKNDRKIRKQQKSAKWD